MGEATSDDEEEEEDEEGDDDEWEDDEDAEALRLIDGAYDRAVAEGALCHWASEATSEITAEAVAEGTTMDLHGYSVPLACAAVRHALRNLRSDAAVERALFEHVAGASDALFERGMLVITGRGKGSGVDAVLAPAVLRLLSHEGIAATVVEGNDGRVAVDGKSLRAWAEREVDVV